MISVTHSDKLEHVVYHYLYSDVAKLLYLRSVRLLVYVHFKAIKNMANSTTLKLNIVKNNGVLKTRLGDL